MRILIVGASGSGTTTLGATLARRLAFAHFDTDDYYWLPTSPPFRQKRDPAQRLALLAAALDSAGDAVVSGSLMGWGQEIEDCFDLIVFLYVPTGLRIERLRSREIERHGRVDEAFLQWAAEYDEGPPMGRSLARHRAWLDARQAPVLCIEGDTSVDYRVGAVWAALR
jgi:adenylate kinase family enzyme